jgi:hypothetical protein
LMSPFADDKVEPNVPFMYTLAADCIVVVDDVDDSDTPAVPFTVTPAVDDDSVAVPDDTAVKLPFVDAMLTLPDDDDMLNPLLALPTMF